MLWETADDSKRDRANYMKLRLPPLYKTLLMLALVPRLRRLVALIFIGGNVLAFALLMLPKHQYNLDVIAMLSPINLAVAVYLLRVRSRTN